MKTANLPDSFFTIFRRERITPYTSLASSSKGNPVVGCRDTGGGVADVDIAAGEDPVLLKSPRATTTPEEVVNVFRGLPNEA